MLIYIASITDVNIAAQNKSDTSEFIASIVCLITMFSARFIIDFIFQLYSCVGQKCYNTKIIWNCINIVLLLVLLYL